MRVTQEGVDTQIAQIAHEGDGLITAIVAFFKGDDNEVAPTPESEPARDLPKRSRARTRERAATPPILMRR